MLSSAAKHSKAWELWFKHSKALTSCCIVGPVCNVNECHIFHPWGPLQVHNDHCCWAWAWASEWVSSSLSSSTSVAPDLDCYTSKQVSENIQLHLCTSLSHFWVPFTGIAVCQWPYALIELLCLAVLERRWLSTSFHKHSHVQGLSRYCRLSLSVCPDVYFKIVGWLWAGFALDKAFYIHVHAHVPQFIHLNFLNEFSDSVFHCHSCCQR